MSRLLYRAARVLAGPDLETVQHGGVLVEAGLVGYVGPARGAPRADQTLDLGDATLLPGLVDCHAHLSWDASAEPHAVVARETPTRTILRAARHARQHLLAGVTALRDLGAADGISIPLARAIAAGDLAGPTIVPAGRCIVMTGGHGWFLGREADGPDAVRAAVRAELKAGARCIKLIASGGVYGKDELVEAPQLGLDELRAAVDEAHHAGRHVAAHAYAPGPIGNALAAGVDSIEHGSLLDRPTAERMRERGTVLVPTLSVYAAMARSAERLGTPEYIVRKTAQVIESSRAAFRLARQAGVALAAGTDCGAPGHGHGTLPDELALMVACGASPREALRIGTLNGARLLRLADRLGSLEPGRQADLLAVGGDPTAEIERLAEVRLVVQDGRIVVGEGATQLP